VTIRKEDFTYSLALIIISAYIVFFGIVMYQNPGNNYEGLKTITATFGTIVAGVVGYYFGQRPAEQAIKSAAESKAKLQDETTSELAEINDGLVSWKKNYEAIRRLISDLGEQ
jgi:uncharacterized membrane protein